MRIPITLLSLLLPIGASAQVQINDYKLPGSSDQASFNQYVLPNITGITIPVNWAAVDACGSAPCTPATYSWATGIETALLPYTSTGQTCYGTVVSPCLCAGGQLCKINFEVNAVKGAGSNNSTPSYVLDAAGSTWSTSCPAIGNVPACTTAAPNPVDVCFCNAYQGSGSPPANTCINNMNSPPVNTTGVPATWEIPFQSAYLGFIKAMIQRYNSGVTWHSQVGYIRFGMGVGGGGAIPCYTQETTLPTPPLTLSVWGAFATNVFSYASSQQPLMTIESSGYGGNDPVITLAWADAVAQNSIPYGAGFGAESLAFHDMVLYSEGSPCSNDWCSIFNTYYGISPMLGLQTISSSSDATCDSDPGAALTCSLAYVIPFGIQRHANVFEISSKDLLCAFYGAYSAPTTCTQQPNGFAAALLAAAAGQPASTSAAAGSTMLSGSAILQ